MLSPRLGVGKQQPVPIFLPSQVPSDRGGAYLIAGPLRSFARAFLRLAVGGTMIKVGAGVLLSVIP